MGGVIFGFFPSLIAGARKLQFCPPRRQWPPINGAYRPIHLSKYSKEGKLVKLISPEYPLLEKTREMALYYGKTSEAGLHL